MSKDFDFIVVGGGAAGCFAAITAAQRGRKTVILEHNGIVGKKLLITGKGRCNVTNNCSEREVMDNIPRNPRFMYSSLSQMKPYDVMEFFEACGVPLKTERGQRVFPVSDDAKDIVKALSHKLKECNVSVMKKEVTALIIEDGVCKGVKCQDESIYAESVLIATGGKSYPGTGSKGAGYALAESAGHTIITPEPSLVPMTSNAKYCADMMGLSLKNVTLKLYDGEKCIYSELGEMLFTHFGVSGPLVLSASSHIDKMESGRYKILIDLKPALDEQKLDARIQRDFSENINRTFINSLGKLLPSKMVPHVVKLSGIDGEMRVNQITKEERHKLLSVIKAFPVPISGFRPIEEAIITSGGVSTKEISPKTMESKLVSGLFFAGEVIDVDAYTGGFNLQVAFSTGYAAGLNV